MAVLDHQPRQRWEQKSDRHAPRRHLAAYLTAGVLLTAMGRMVITWIAYDFDHVSTEPGDFFKAMYDPRVVVEPELFHPYVWAFTAALLVTGLVALLHRRAGRGAALMCAFVMFVVSARELVGMAASDEFRHWYIGGNDLEAAIVSSWSVALLFSLTALVMLLRASDRPVPGAPLPPRPGSPLYGASGALMLVLGLALAGWIVRMLTRDGADVGAYFHGLVDASEARFPMLAGSTELYETVFAVALLVLGVQALLRRPVVRGASIVLLGVVLYLYVRQMIGMTITEDGPGAIEDPSATTWVPDWDAYTHDWEGRLLLATYVGGSLIAVAVIAMMLRAPDMPAEASIPSAPGGYVPPQPTGQPVPQGQAPGQARPQPRYDAMPQAPTMAAPVPPPPSSPPPSSPPPAPPGR